MSLRLKDIFIDQRDHGGLRMWQDDQAYLLDTCLSAQDGFIERYIPLTKSYEQTINRI